MTAPAGSRLTPRNWVIISSINWTENWQMHQQLASALVDAGHRVLFIENTGVRTPRRGDLGRIWNRLANWWRSTRGFADVRQHLTLLFPLCLPLPYSRVALFINRHLLDRTLHNWMTANRFHDPVVVSFLPTPLAQAMAAAIDPALLIYYCANDMSGGSEEAAQLRKHEDAFLARADAVFCISSVLMARARQFNQQVSCFPAGVDFEMFDSARRAAIVADDLAGLRKPIVGYVGAISPVFDQTLLAETARRLPDLDFVLVGPAYVAVDKLAACPNIHLLGSRAHDVVPYYLNGFDVGLIPYLRNSFTDAVYSCKLNEYLAMGLPVIATGMREVREYSERHANVVDMADNPEAMAAAIRRLTAGHDEALRESRISAAAANSWEQRFADICEVVHQRLIETGDRPGRWQDRLRSLYRRGQVRIARTALLLAGVYGLLFHTPLLWLAGEALVSRAPAQAADAIMVFAVEGEPAFVGASFQKRALDALALYRAGHAPRIFVSSSKDSSVSEAEIIRALLVGQGVPAQAIWVLAGKTHSTAEGVRLSADVLRQHGVRQALLLTSPYISLRAQLVWRKLAPDLTVLAQPAVDNPPPEPTWQTNLRTARAIAYEYLALAYYHWKGWV